MNEEEIGVRIGKLNTALIEGRCKDFAAMFAKDGVYDHTTQGRELEALGQVTGASRIAEVAAKWLESTTNRELVGQSYLVHPDLPGPNELPNVPPVAYAIVAEFTFRAISTDQPGRVVVKVQSVLCLTTSGHVGFMQSGEAIIRA